MTISDRTDRQQIPPRPLRPHAVAPAAVVADRAHWQATDGTVVLVDVSTGVVRGQVTAIVGASGAGKSTLLRLLAGDLQPTGGSVHGGSGSVPQRPHRRIGYVPQDDVLHRDLPLERMLVHAARLRTPRGTRRPDVHAAVRGALVATDLADVASRAVRHLSGGQRRRASIAVELLTDPDVLFLDEPTSGLDPSTGGLVMEELRAMADAGRTIVLVTHQAADLAACDRVVALSRDGRVAFDGTMGDALATFGCVDVEQLHHRLIAAVAASPTGSPVAKCAPVPIPDRPFASRWRQWWTLTTRSWELVRHSPLTLGIMVASPAMVVAMFAVLFRPGAFDPAAPSPQATVMIAFWVAFGSFFFGLTFGLLQICPELDVIRRERRAGVAPWLHVASKLTAFAPVLVFVDVVMLAVLRRLDRLPALDLGELGRLTLTLAAGSVAALALGLLASAAVGTPAQASLALPMLCFPAVLFSGAIVPVPVMAPAGRAVAAMMSSRWSFEAIGRDLGLRELFAAGGSPLGRPLLDEFATTWTVDAMTAWAVLTTFALGFVVTASAVLTHRVRR